MLIPIALIELPDRRLRAFAPDLPACDLCAATEEELLPKIAARD